MIESITFGPHFIKLEDEFDFSINMGIEDNYEITSFNVDLIFPQLQEIFYTNSGTHDTYKDFQLHFRSGENFSLKSPGESFSIYTEKRLIGNLFALGLSEENQLNCQMFGNNITMSYILNDDENRTYDSYALSGKSLELSDSEYLEELSDPNYLPLFRIKPWPEALDIIPEHYIPYNFYLRGSFTYHSLDNNQEEDSIFEFETDANYYLFFNSCFVIIDPFLGPYKSFLKSQELNLSSNIDIFFDIDALLRNTQYFTTQTLTDNDLKQIPLILTFTNDITSNYYFSDREFHKVTDSISFVYSNSLLDDQHNLLINPVKYDTTNSTLTSSRVLHYSLDLNSTFLSYDDVILGAECHDKISLPYIKNVEFGFYIPYFKFPYAVPNGTSFEEQFETITTIGYYTNEHYLNLKDYINNNNMSHAGNIFSVNKNINEYKFNIDYFYMHPYELINNKYIYAPTNGIYNKIDASFNTNIKLQLENEFYDLFLIPGKIIPNQKNQEFSLRLDKKNSIITYSDITGYEVMQQANDIDISKFNTRYTETLKDKIINRGTYIQIDNIYTYTLSTNEELFFNTFGFLGDRKKISKDNFTLNELEFDDILQTYWNYILNGGNFRIPIQEIPSMTFIYDPENDNILIKVAGGVKASTNEAENNTAIYRNISFNEYGILSNDFPFDYYHVSLNSKEVNSQTICHFQDLNEEINIPKSLNDGDWLVIAVDSSIRKHFSNLQSPLIDQPIYKFGIKPKTKVEILKKFRTKDGTSELIRGAITESSSTIPMGTNIDSRLVTNSFTDIVEFNSTRYDIRNFYSNSFLSKKVFTINQYSDNNKYLNISKNGISIGLQESSFDESNKKFEISSEYTTYFYGKTNIFPVGSIYLTLTPDNPEQYFVGRWVPFGVGKTIIGTDLEKVVVDTTNNEFNYINNPTTFNNANLIGGEETHTLTADEIPAHNHAFSAVGITASGGNNGATAGSYRMTGRWNDISNSGTSNPDGYGMGTYTPATVGNGQAHNNLPPYITCYMWLRIN